MTSIKVHRLLSLIAMHLIFLGAMGQCKIFSMIDFENYSGEHCLLIDSINNPKNIWQIGVPNKKIFTSAHSSPNVISTHLSESYPTNDTSRFLLHNDGKTTPNIGLVFDFYVDTDSLKDFCKVEILADKASGGQIWVDPLKNDSIYPFRWIGKKPILTGTSLGWQRFHLDYKSWRYGNDTLPSYLISDEVLFRFTFISDSIETNQDGWMMDNIRISYFLSAEELQIQSPTAYPNPFTSTIYVDGIPSTFTYSIFNQLGQQLIQGVSDQGKIKELDGFQQGIYILSVDYEDTAVYIKIIKE
jgi:Secretion system C-terminal sorting domain